MRALIKAVFRVLLIFIFINMLIYTTNYISTVISYTHIDPTQEKSNIFPYIIGISAAFILFTLVLLFLWRKTDRVIRFVSGNISENEIAINTSNGELHRVVMRILGIFLIVSNIPQLVVTSGYYFFYSHLSEQAQVELTTNEKLALIMRGITILLGIWLVIGNKGIIDFKNKISNLIDADNKDKEPPASDEESHPSDGQKG